MSDRETPGHDDEIDGWRIRWKTRSRYYFAGVHPTPDTWDRDRITIHEPVLILTKPGRQWIEVKGQSDIERPAMLAHGMVSAMLCDAHFAREWGDEAAAFQHEARAEQWRKIVNIRTVAAAVERVGARAARMAIGPAGAGAKGR